MNTIYVANWHDGVDVATYGMPDGAPNEPADRIPSSIDFYNNDFYNMGDNCIESDGGSHNIRVFRNRCFNSTGGALCASPFLGGPDYFYQNLIYNTTTSGAMKFGTSAGLVVYQNTFIGDGRTAATANEHFANNLILSSDGPGAIFSVSTYTSYSSSDYNGFRAYAGSEHAFEWDSPPTGTTVLYGVTQLANRQFKTLADYSRATGQDTHIVMEDYDTFVKASKPDTKDLQRLYSPEDFDFRLAPGSPAVDAGMVLPTINDGFTGRTPDLGAYDQLFSADGDVLKFMS